MSKRYQIDMKSYDRLFPSQDTFKDVETIAYQASKTGQVIAARHSPVEETDEPWMRLPSGKKRFKVDIRELPPSLDAVLANRIYIKTGQAPLGLV